MYDLIVAGGGLAGVCAAVTAGGNGVKTLLLEEMPYFGGLATGGLVNPFMTHKTRDGKTKLVGGIFDEIKDRLAKKNGLMVNCFNSEVMKEVLFDMVQESNITYKLNCVAKDIKKENNIFYVNEYKSKYLIDATGDGFLAYRLGCDYEGGDKGETQSLTLMFTMNGVDTYKAMDYARNNPHDFLFPKWDKSEDIENIDVWSLAGFYSIIEAHKEEFNCPGNLLFFIPTATKYEVTFNQTHVTVKDSTNREELKKAYTKAYKQVLNVADFVVKYVPGFEKAKISKIADLIGVREGRRIMGEYVFSEDDVVNGHKFSDSILKLAYPVDVHKAKGYDKEDLEKEINNLGESDWYELPFRSLKTQIENLLVVGKCVSSTQGGHGAIRIMPACMATGEAGGYGVSIAVKNNCSLNDINIKELQRCLKINNI